MDSISLFLCQITFKEDIFSNVFAKLRKHHATLTSLLQIPHTKLL